MLKWTTNGLIESFVVYPMSCSALFAAIFNKSVAWIAPLLLFSFMFSYSLHSIQKSNHPALYNSPRLLTVNSNSDRNDSFGLDWISSHQSLRN